MSLYQDVGGFAAGPALGSGCRLQGSLAVRVKADRADVETVRWHVRGHIVKLRLNASQPESTTSPHDCCRSSAQRDHSRPAHGYSYGYSQSFTRP